MAARKYLNDSGLEHLSSYVNAKLTVVSTMPSAPTELRTVLYIGETTEDYIQGGIYLYDEDNDEWILISTADVDLTDYETSWTGTTTDWALLDPTEQAKYSIVNFTDDYTESGDVTGIVAGYYYDGKFYEDSSHTTEISGLEGYIYIDLDGEKLYLYNGTAFVICSGEGGGVVEGYYYNGKFYEDSAHTTEITGQSGLLYVDVSTNYVYRYDSTESEFVQVSGGGSTLTAGFGVKIANDEISTTDFVGTQAEWDAKTAAQKAEYDFIHITDDASQVSYSPGHSISDGTSEKTQREILEFDGFTVTDDSTNGKTKVAEVPYTAGDGVEITEKEISVSDEISRTWTGTKAEWDAIADKSVYDGWIINITDDSAVGSYIEDAVTEGSLNAVTSGATYDAITNLFSIGKITKNDNSIPANDKVDLTIDVSQANKEAIGIVGIVSSGSSYSVLSHFYLSDNMAYIRVKNTSNTAIVISIAVHVLYQNAL